MQGMKELLCAKGASIQAANITAAVNPTADLWNAESQAGLQSTFGVAADDVARVRSTWAFVSGGWLHTAVSHAATSVPAV